MSAAVSAAVSAAASAARLTRDRSRTDENGVELDNFTLSRKSSPGSRVPLRSGALGRESRRPYPVLMSDGVVGSLLATETGRSELLGWADPRALATTIWLRPPDFA